MRLSILAIVLMMLTAGYSFADQPKVLFDQAHGQLFYIDKDGNLDLTDLAGVFRDQGYDVLASKSPITTEILEGVDALIISGAFQNPSRAETAVIKEFVNSGGKLAVMLHVGPLVSKMLEQLGVAVSRGVVRDTLLGLGGKATDFNVHSLAGHELFQSIDHFTIYGAWALQPLSKYTRTMAQTNPSAWLDMQRNQIRGNNPQGRFPLVVRGQIGQGEFLVFGDDALFQNQFLVGNNLQLGKNLAGWMAQ